MSKFRHVILSEGAAIDYNTGPFTSEQTLTEVRVKSNIAAGVNEERLTVTLDSKDGAAFDVVIISRDMDIISDYVATDIGFLIEVGDALRVQFANSKSRTVSVRLVLQ